MWGELLGQVGMADTRIASHRRRKACGRNCPPPPQRHTHLSLTSTQLPLWPGTWPRTYSRLRTGSTRNTCGQQRWSHQEGSVSQKEDRSGEGGQGSLEYGPRVAGTSRLLPCSPPAYNLASLPPAAHLAVLHRHTLATHAPRHLLALEHLARVLQAAGWEACCEQLVRSFKQPRWPTTCG